MSAPEEEKKEFHAELDLTLVAPTVEGAETTAEAIAAGLKGWGGVSDAEVGVVVEKREK